MKKVYVWIVLVICIIGARYAFKKFSPSTLPTEETLTGTVLSWEELTGIVETWTVAMQELTGEFDSWEVPMVSGSDVKITTGQSTIIERFKSLLKKRKALPKDEKKLTEDDIDFIDGTIQAIKNLK